MLRPGRLRAATGSRSKEFSGGQSSTKEEAAIQPGIRSWRKSGLAYGRLSRRGSTLTISTNLNVSGVRCRSFARPPRADIESSARAGRVERWASNPFDFTTGFGPILERPEVEHIRIAEILQDLPAESGSSSGCAVEDD